ncbi:aminopeptidase [Candidatus Methanocrinis natronophilus]|uniref:Aminopeptidase n=1 Tax=Candidatus Methanocrinis natronophilus TaxID=3033396 RepID=A0ABT5X8A4_9EURY|nr:aminopeptidase [Candidatus Methanocrinis natronophilus]MDF0590913.1 aminopeptidase [Candidatus Methanocrinis natronophilus]
MKKYASIIVSDNLKIRPGEEVVIFADRKNLEYCDDLACCIRGSDAQVSTFYIPEIIRPVEKITDIHSNALISADAVIYILETKGEKLDLSKEVAFRHYLCSLPIQYKGRVCMMPGFSEEMKEAAMIDYSELNRRSRNLKQILTDKNIRIMTDLGTDVRFSLYQREIKIDDGDLSKPGLFGNIPAGEIFTAPVEETMNGRLVIDGSIGGLGQVKMPFRIDIKAGIIQSMDPIGKKDDIFEKFSEICEYDSPATKRVGEFGIGLNPGARIIGNMLMDEKVEGTVHFAFGDSYGLGKSSTKYHTDLLIRNPSIFVEDRCIMKNGKFIADI